MRLKSLATSLLPAVCFLLLWQLYSHGDSRRLFLFSSPLQVWQTASEELLRAEFWRNVLITGAQALFGLLVGTVLGTLLGLVLSSHKGISRISMPYLLFFGAVPVFAIAPMLIIWFGTGLLSKVVMAALGVFFVALSHAFEGARVAENQYLEFARSIAAPPLRVALKITLPGALRWAVLGLRTSIGVALLGSFLAEFVSSEAGLGRYILSAGSLYDVPRVLLGVTLISGLALLGSGFVGVIERRHPMLRG